MTILTLSQVRNINQLTKKHNSLIDRINEIKPDANWNRYTLRHVLSYAGGSWNYDYKTLVNRLNECIDTAQGKLNRELTEQKKNEAKQAYIDLCNEKPLEGYYFTLNQIRYIFNEYNAVNYKDYSFRDLLVESVEKELSFTEIITLISNIYNDYISFENFQAGEYYHENGKFYEYDSYVMTMEGNIVKYEDAVMCQDSDEYTSDPVTLRGIRDGRAKVRAKVVTIARSVARECYYVCSWNDDLYYTEESAEYYGLYIDENGEVTDEPENDPDDYLESNHRDHIFKTFTDNPRFYIGLEVEKEDRDVLTSEYIDDFLEDTDHYFKKVADCSLDRDSGYELNTPAMELLPQEIDKFLSSYPTIVDHINGDYSLSNCGGHINLSEKGLDGDQFFDKIKGYAPLFYALNPTRIDAYWSRAYDTKTLKRDKKKAQAIAIWDDRIELRIFSAVENYEQLLWRVELCKLICDNPTDDFKQAFFNCHTVLKAHLEKGLQNEYFDPRNEYKNYNDFIDAIVKHTLNYENVDLNA